MDRLLGQEHSEHHAEQNLVFRRNLAAGMAGQFNSGVQLSADVWFYVGLAVIGGFIGSWIGSKKMNNQSLRYLLAFVLVLAISKLVFS